MTRRMRRWLVLALALLMVVSQAALAAEIVSEPFRVEAQERPEETGGEAPSAPKATHEAAAPEPAPEITPVPVPENPIGREQVCLNDASDSVNLYAAADAASEIVGTLGHGDVVDVYVEAGAWTLICANDVQGWIASGHLKEVGAAEPQATTEPEQSVEPEATAEPEQSAAEEEPTEGQGGAQIPLEPSEQPAEPEQPVEQETPEEPEQPAEPERPAESEAAVRMVVRTGARDGMVNLRAAASYGATILATLREGDVVFVLAAEGGWIKVRTADGTEGYMGAKYLSEEQPEQPGETEPELPAFDYARDEEGNLLLDEAGDPIPLLGEDAALKPVSWQRDESGALILDENGNPIPVDVLPVEAEKITTLADALDPNRAIDIYINWADAQAGAHAYGDEAVLTAVLRGYDNVKYSLQWQVSADDVVYVDVPGATEARYVTAVTEENIMDYWRVTVTITDVVE